MDSKLDLSPNELETAKKLAISLVKHINEAFLGKNKDICATLEYKKLHDAQIVDIHLNKYSVIFETSPSGAVFEGLAQLKDANEFELIGKISRINLYGLTADCMPDYVLKNFCYCIPKQDRFLKIIGIG